MPARSLRGKPHDVLMASGEPNAEPLSSPNTEELPAAHTLPSTLHRTLLPHLASGNMTALEAQFGVSQGSTEECEFGNFRSRNCFVGRQFANQRGVEIPHPRVWNEENGAVEAVCISGAPA